MLPAQPEPWLRGPLSDVDPLLAPPIYALTQADEDLTHHTASLTTEEIWSTPHGLAPLGFHLRHIAGSLDRLTTYLANAQLSASQLTALRAERVPGADRDELLPAIHHAIDQATHTIRTLDPTTLRDPRSVGRKHLPTTVIGLAVHLAEHTQRHVGQSIALCQLLRALR